MVGVSGGVVHLGLGLTLDRQRLRHRGDHRLDVGGVSRLQAAHEGVLADLALGQELLGCAAAHRPGHRRHDDVAHAEPVEDPLVGVAVRVIDGLRPSSSTSNEYESFMTNSRPRRMPARGRASSRYFVWIWYSSSGKSL